MHDRVRGKLKGYINPPERTLREYSADDANVGSRMARAIALSKQQDTDAAIAIIDDLIAASPEDPFLYDLKGDLLVDAGRTHDAVVTYEKALSILPWAALIQFNLARLQLENARDAPQIREARRKVNEALRYEPEMASGWRLLAIAEGRLSNNGGASLALAEEALLRGKKKSALTHAQQALERLAEGSPGWFRAQDIESAVGKEQ